MEPSSNNSDQGEITPAQEQSVVCKSGFEREYQGTLILTNKRLLFVVANQEEDINLVPWTTARLRFADVEDLNKILPNPSNLSIPIEEIEVEKAREGLIRHPSLKVKWKEAGIEKSAEFVEDIAGSGRKKDLKDWAKVIDSLKSAKISIQFPKAPVPNNDSLEGRILYLLNDMQEKGVFEIEKELEDKFHISDLDLDEIDSACHKLASEGFLDVINDPSGDNFYRKRSPLGEDDLSS